MRRIFLALGLLPSLAFACINDRDTLAYELANRPDTQKALIGWFDRYPAKYYQVRIQRLRAKDKLTNPELDDLAVAYERIGETDAALKVIAQKAARTLDKEQSYTLHANRGTFFAHRWVYGRNGADLDLAIADIRKALEIKPDAHFGREQTQLNVLIALKKYPDTSFGRSLPGLQDKESLERGLAGLIMLGAAWESPDVAAALAQILKGPKTSAVAQIAALRANELIAAGRKSITGKASEDLSVDLGLSGPYGEPPLVDQFRKLRAAADKRHDDRTAFILARLDAGRHPDTDPKFWDGWEEPAMPEADRGSAPLQKPPYERGSNVAAAIVYTAISIITILGLAGVVWLVRRRLRRRR